MPPVFLVSDGGDAEVFQRGDPLSEDGVHGGVALCVDTADFARAVIDIEVAGEQLVLGGDGERAGNAAHEFRKLHLVGVG